MPSIDPCESTLNPLQPFRQNDLQRCALVPDSMYPKFKKTSLGSLKIIDHVHAHVAPDLVRDAFEEAADRGLVDRNSLPDVISYLTQFFAVSGSKSGPRFCSSPSRRTPRLCMRTFGRDSGYELGNRPSQTCLGTARRHERSREVQDLENP